MRRWPTWRRYALALTGDRADADDVVQDAVIATLRAGPALRTEADANRYVRTAVRTAALRLFRGRRAVARSGTELDRRPAGRRGTLAVVLAREGSRQEQRRWARVISAMEELPAEQRQAVELLVLAERPLKLREVAEIQAAPISTVHSRLQAAIRRLGEAVADGASTTGRSGM